MPGGGVRGQWSGWSQGTVSVMNKFCLYSTVPTANDTTVYLNFAKRVDLMLCSYHTHMQIIIIIIKRVGGNSGR